MFPLNKRVLIRGCAAHIRAGLSCGADYQSYYVPLYASHSGTLSIPYPRYKWTWRGRVEGSGGNWLRITRPNGDKIEFAHLSKFIKKSGPVRAGELIAITGNTGSVTSYPHLHVQILNKAGKRLDPENYDWSEEGKITNEEIKGLYRKYWMREPAEGDWKYFRARLDKGSIIDEVDLIAKMQYTYAEFKKKGDAWWQQEKDKWL